MTDSPTPEPEVGPPSATPEPPAPKALTTGNYLIELGNRLIEHSKVSVIGKTPKREVDIAGRLLRTFGEEWVERKNNAT